MPEYLAPGVYVEEVSFRSKTIEGVATSTTGYAGLTRFGPVQFSDPGVETAASSEPRLITSFTEFERVYGGLAQLMVERGDGQPTSTNYLAHAARAFFANGGQRLYISRVFSANGTSGVARLQRTLGNGDDVAIRARWPGAYGNVLLSIQKVMRGNVAYQAGAFGTQARGLSRGAVVEVTDGASTDLMVIETDDSQMLDGLAKQIFVDAGGTPVVPGAAASIKEVTLQVVIHASDERVDVIGELATHPAQRRWIGRILQATDPEDENAILWCETDAPDDRTTNNDLVRAIDMMNTLETVPEGVRLTGGNDGNMPIPDDLLGKEADPDNPSVKATGLKALGEITDIAIVALPDASTYGTVVESEVAVGHLIDHATEDRYRIAVVDAPRASSLNEVREFRGKFDSKYAAMYHPWIEILDPLERAAQGAPPRRLLLPPSGFVSGIYARNDIARGVYKAPANEIVRGLTKFEANINKARNDVLNPEGINALRFFEGRGNRVWGARTMTSDPEWKYVNVRRLFIYLEHSIDKAMQWAVFEPNNNRLWSNIRLMVEDFLYVQWLNGALLGDTPEDAYFVRCDRTTMSQNDLDNGRLVCLIGVAPTKPAEYVIFRIGQWTADSQI